MSEHDARVVARTTLEHWLECHGADLTKDEHAAIASVITELPQQPLAHKVKRQRALAHLHEEWMKKNPRRDS